LSQTINRSTGADVVIVAGEASGDFLAAHLIKALRLRYPDIRIAGIAGSQMAEAGCETWAPQEKLAVRGYVEVLRHLPELLKLRKEMLERTIKERPKLFIGVDAPDFNLALETRLKEQGIPTIHYVSPSLWAWRPERIAKIKAAVQHMLLLFPFEADLYQKEDIPHTVIGHPVTERFDPFSPVRPFSAEEPIRVAILPGSRKSEMVFHARLFSEALQKLRQKGLMLELYVPIITHEHRPYLEPLLTAFPSIHVSVGDSHAVLKQAHVGLIASGTASLEAALANCPHLITYRLHPLTARMVRKKLTLPYVGLPNVLSGEFVVPELLQEAATPDNLAQGLETLIVDQWSRDRQHVAFGSIFYDLHRPHVSLLWEALDPFLGA
jgi:lipid-A-disaccharide synthase